MHSLNHWYRVMFEKLGWIVLAKGKGYDYKVETYKKSLENLIKTAEHLMDEYKNTNRHHDLKVIVMNTEFLLNFVELYLD
jgi:Tfp pilus assembly PilM family ATPase